MAQIRAFTTGIYESGQSSYEGYRTHENRLRYEENGTVEAERAELGHVGGHVRKLVELITDDDAPVKALEGELRLLKVRRTELGKP